jgi:putative ABC transport system permease protein
MRSLAADLRFAVRSLGKSPAFTLLAVATLALGLGATTAIYSLVSHVLLRPLPYPAADRIVRLWETYPSGRGSVSRPNFEDWKRSLTTIDLLSATFQDDLNFVSGAGAGVEAERLRAAIVTEDFFALTGTRALRGRLLSPEAHRSTRGEEVVLAHGLWQRRFGGEDVVGRSITLSGRPYTVVGVLPPDFTWPARPAIEVFLPLDRDPSRGEERGSRYLNVYGRLADGATRERASAELDTVVAGLVAAYPDANAKRGAVLVPLHEHLTTHVRPTLWLLLGAVVLVLLIACGNVANMLLARAASRHGEIAVRVALGASRARLVRLLLTEGLVLAVFGGALGLLVAVWGIDLCVAALRIPTGLFGAGIDGPVFLFAAAAAAGSVLVFGLAPALRAARVDLASTLKESGGKVATGRSLLRSALVVTQIALSFALLVGAGLLVRSFARLASVPPGFDPTNVVTLETALPEVKYDDDAEVAGFYRRLLDEVRALPGVESAGVVNFLPLSPHNVNGNFAIEGRTIPEGIEPITEFLVTSPDYFRAMRIPIVAGRPLAPSDLKTARPVAVINQTMARRFFPGEDAVGKRLILEWAADRPIEIVGVLADVKRWGLDSDPVPETYLPLEQLPQAAMALAVRLTRPPDAADVLGLRRAVARVDPEQAIHGVSSLEGIVAGSLSSRRVNMLLLAVFAAAALLLAAVGVYGVVSVQVTHRTRELGIRMALGATAGRVRALVLREGAILAALGLAAGAAAAAGVVRLVSGLLFGVKPTDPLTFVAMALVLGAVTLLACYLPARRATRIDPMIALRA